MTRTARAMAACLTVGRYSVGVAIALVGIAAAFGGIALLVLAAWLVDSPGALLEHARRAREGAPR